MTKNNARLGEIKARLANATPGPWAVARGFDYYDGLPYRYVRFSQNSDSTIMDRDEDAEFISAAPDDVGWLLRYIDEQNAKIQAIRRVASSIAVGWDQQNLSPVQLTYAQAFMEAARRIFVALDDEETAQRIGINQIRSVFYPS